MSSKKGARRNRSSQTEGGPAGIYEASVLLGWVVPTSEKEVLSAERDLAASPVTLPQPLRDPRAVLDQTGQHALQRRALACFADNPQAGAALARAAREAGRLTPEVEERMRRDRKAAEEKQDKGRDGKDVR